MDTIASTPPSVLDSGALAGPTHPTGGGQPPDPFTRLLLEAMIALRDGDFSVRLPPDTVGLNGRLADAFNEIATVTERRARETARVSRMVGKEGKLKQRMAVPGVVGGWADEVAAINMLIDDLVWPTTEVTRAVGAVAKGDLGQAMALEVDGRPLEGEFLRSARLVNKMIDQLSVFTWRARWAPRASSVVRLRSRPSRACGRTSPSRSTRWPAT
jgi:hypothetical protein